MEELSFPRLWVANNGMTPEWLSEERAIYFAKVADVIELAFSAGELPHGRAFISKARETATAIGKPLKIFAYVPIGFWYTDRQKDSMQVWNTTMFALDARGAWMRNSDGSFAKGIRANERFVDMRKDEAVRAMQEAYAKILSLTHNSQSCFDGLRVDVASPTIHYLMWNAHGADIGGSYYQFDADMADGMRRVFDAVRTADVIVNEGYLPGPGVYLPGPGVSTADPNPYMSITGAMSESWPDAKWYSSNPKIIPPNMPRGSFESRYNWQIQTIRDQGFMDDPMVLIPNGRSTHDLFTLGSACLLEDGYYMPYGRQWPDIPKVVFYSKDGDGVVADSINRNWLGKAMSSMQTSMGVDSREFENGVVAVNPTSDEKYWVPPRLVQDVETGEVAAGFTIDPETARFFVNINSTEPGPLSLEQRVARLERDLHGLVTAVGDLADIVKSHSERVEEAEDALDVVIGDTEELKNQVSFFNEELSTAAEAVDEVRTDFNTLVRNLRHVVDDFED